MYQVYEALRNAQTLRGNAPQAGRFGSEMRAIAARLQPSFTPDRALMVAVTACGWGEGTSTIAQELAEHLAQQGHRVLLCAPLSGDVTTLDAAAREIMPGMPSRTDISDLCQLQSGGASKTQFGDWLALQSRGFEIVILDLPPLIQHQSWGTLLQRLDGVILVVEAEKTRSVIIETTLRAIQDNRGQVLGFVLNKRRQYVPRFLYRWL